MAIVDSPLGTIQQLVDTVEELEGCILFDQRRTGRPLARHLFQLRKDLVQLHRVA